MASPNEGTLLPFSKIPLPAGAELDPKRAPRKDKTNAVLTRSFLVDPATLAHLGQEPPDADRLGDTKRKTASELQREMLAAQAKKVELARYLPDMPATAGSFQSQAADAFTHDDDDDDDGGVQTGKTRFEGIDTPDKKKARPEGVDTLAMSQTGASYMSGQQTKVVEHRRWQQDDDKKSGTVTGRMTEEIMQEHITNLQKLEELTEHLTHLKEAKDKERSDRTTRLKNMHIFERLDDRRESKILARHEKRQREWEDFRARMVRKLGRHHDPDNLVFNRAEEYRAMLEEKDLLMQAQPIESRQGSNVWQMSLRDAWTRYIAVGGPFSGLEMPYIDRPELRPDSVYIIRNPSHNTEQYADEICLDPKTGQPTINPKTKQPYTRRDLGVSVHPSMNLDKVKQSRQHLPGELTRKQWAKQAYSKALTILQPSELLSDGLCARGEGYAARFAREKLAEEGRLAEEEAARRKEEEKARKRAANRGRTRGGTITDAQSVRSGATTAASAAGGILGAAEEADVARGIEPEAYEPEEEAPLMSFQENRLVLQATVGTGRAGEARLPVMNVGNCAVYYSWSRAQVGLDILKDKPELPPGGKDGLQRFFMKDVAGSILPGGAKDFVFTFKAEKPGVFMEEWTFSGTPAVSGCQHKVQLKGICVAEDKTRAKRAALEGSLAVAERDHTVQELVDEVVEHIGTPRTKPRVLAEDPDVDRQVFIAQNKEAQIYYSNTTLKLFRSLADSTFELLAFPMELRKWDSSLTSLKRLLYAIDDDYERERHIVQLNEIMKNAGIPPTSTAMFNSICYELVSELADAVPDLSAGIRNKLELPKKHLQPKREDLPGELADQAKLGKQGAVIMEERILTYTTEPPPPKGELDIWHYDNHLLLIGGPPVQWFYKEGEEPARDPVTDEERVGTIKLKKKLMVEMWDNDGADGDAPAAAEGEDPADEHQAADGSDAKEASRDAEDLGRLEFEYLLRLNDAVYYHLASMTERMALLNVEADLRSQVIAQVVIELNEAAAEEIRTLIKEDKEDEARKIDPAKYQNIVDLDQVFRAVMKQEEEEKEKLLKRANTLNQAQMAAAASAANAPAVVAVGQNGPEQA